MAYIDELENNIDPAQITTREADISQKWWESFSSDGGGTTPDYWTAEGEKFQPMDYIKKGYKGWVESKSKPITEVGGLPLDIEKIPAHISEEDKPEYSLWEGVGVTVDEARDRLPIRSLTRAQQLDMAGGLVGEDGGGITSRAMGTSMLSNGRFGTVNIKDITSDPNFNPEALDSALLSPYDWGILEDNKFLTEDEYKDSMWFHKDLKFPDGVYSGVAKILKERKEVELQRKDILSKAPQDVIAQITYFGAALGTEFTDIPNVALMLVPIAGEAKWLGALGKNKYIRRSVKGGIEGLVGNIPPEAIAYEQLKREQAEWTIEDSMFNVFVMGPIAGAGMRNVIGAAGDFNIGGNIADAVYFPKTMRSIDNVLGRGWVENGYHNNEALTLKAFSDMDNDKVVNVDDMANAQTLNKTTPEDVVDAGRKEVNIEEVFNELEEIEMELMTDIPEKLRSDDEFDIELPDSSKVLTTQLPASSAADYVSSYGLDFTEEQLGRVLHLDYIGVKEEGKGTGSRLLKQVTDHADENNLIIIGRPVSSGKMSDEALRNWYRKHGFEVEQDLDPLWRMVRYPGKEGKARGVVTEGYTITTDAYGEVGVNIRKNDDGSVDIKGFKEGEAITVEKPIVDSMTNQELLFYAFEQSGITDVKMGIKPKADPIQAQITKYRTIDEEGYYDVLLENGSFLRGEPISRELADSLQSAYKLADEELDNLVMLDEIRVSDEGKGTGNKLLKDFLDYADSKGLTVIGDADATGKMSQVDLENWYKKHGFEFTGEWSKLEGAPMVRRPVSPTKATYTAPVGIESPFKRPKPERVVYEESPDAPVNLGPDEYFTVGGFHKEEGMTPRRGQDIHRDIVKATEWADEQGILYNGPQGMGGYGDYVGEFPHTFTVEKGYLDGYFEGLTFTVEEGADFDATFLRRKKEYSEGKVANGKPAFDFEANRTESDVAPEQKVFLDPIEIGPAVPKKVKVSDLPQKVEYDMAESKQYHLFDENGDEITEPSTRAARILEAKQLDIFEDMQVTKPGLERALKVETENITETSMELLTEAGSVAELGKVSSTFAERTAEKYGFDLTLQQERNFWEFKRINAMLSAEGEGTKLLTRMLDLADEKELTIYNTPNAYGRMSQLDLEAWYERHGFEIVSGEGEVPVVMIREPKKVQTPMEVTLDKLDVLTEEQNVKAAKYKAEKLQVDEEFERNVPEEFRGFAREITDYEQRLKLIEEELDMGLGVYTQADLSTRLAKVNAPDFKMATDTEIETSRKIEAGKLEGAEDELPKFDNEETKEYDLYDEDGFDLVDPVKRAEKIFLKKAVAFEDELSVFANKQLEALQKRREPTHKQKVEAFKNNDDPRSGLNTMGRAAFSENPDLDVDSTTIGILKIFDTSIESIEKKYQGDPKKFDKIEVEMDALVKESGLADEYQYGGSYTNKLALYTEMRADMDMMARDTFFKSDADYMNRLEGIDLIKRNKRKAAGLARPDADVKPSQHIDWERDIARKIFMRDMAAGEPRLKKNITAPLYNKILNKQTLKADNYSIREKIFTDKYGIEEVGRVIDEISGNKKALTLEEAFEDQTQSVTKERFTADFKRKEKEAVLKHVRKARNKKLIVDDAEAINRLKTLDDPDMLIKASIHALEGKLSGADISRLWADPNFKDLPDPTKVRGASNKIRIWTENIDIVKENTRLSLEQLLLKPGYMLEKATDAETTRVAATETIATEKQQTGMAMRSDIGEDLPGDKIYNQDVDIQERFDPLEVAVMRESGTSHEVKNQLGDALKNADEMIRKAVEEKNLTPEQETMLRDVYEKLREDDNRMNVDFKETVKKAVNCLD